METAGFRGTQVENRYFTGSGIAKDSDCMVEVRYQRTYVNVLVSSPSYWHHRVSHPEVM
jgi:hypothetical protein